MSSDSTVELQLPLFIIAISAIVVMSLFFISSQSYRKALAQDIDMTHATAKLMNQTPDSPLASITNPTSLMESVMNEVRNTNTTRLAIEYIKNVTTDIGNTNGSNLLGNDSSTISP